MSTRRDEPHVIELKFSEINYFLNDKEIIDGTELFRSRWLSFNNSIRLVEVASNDDTKIYQELKLCRTYKKHTAAIVAFLNERVKACMEEEK